MMKQFQKTKDNILQNQEVLNQAKEILKKEFIGIDQVIDEVVDAISSWYLFPTLQEKPVVINLWGLTGVGKSSLVRRLAQLIGFENKFYDFDLGEGDGNGWSIKDKIEKIYDNVNDYPVLLAFDEFQHTRTVDASNNEIDKPINQVIWQLLDSGKFHISRGSYRLEELYTLTQKLKYMLTNGVQVSEGKIISREEYFIQQMDLQKNFEKVDGVIQNLDINDVLFVPTEYYETILILAKENFSSTFEIKDQLAKLNGYETIKYLDDIFDIGNSPKLVNCSKGLIFILGNLDEAYKMSCDFNPDMDADEFHEQSLKITIPMIKKALKSRFRNEQIARLGNTHILYPAFSAKSFQKIIEMELNKISKKILKHQGIELLFDPSIRDLIYKEGVYPTQGTRPIFTTIHQIISTKLGKVLTEMALKNLVVQSIQFRVEDSYIFADYYDKSKKLHSISIKHQLSLENLRKNKRDDLQAIVAVHEAGHAIISAVLLHTVPEAIFSNTAEVGTGGFVYTKFKWKYISKKEIINRLAMLMGGLVAEKLVFGEENMTTGAESDIVKATEFITTMLKESGMGKLPIAYDTKHPNTRYYVHDETGEINNEAKEWIAVAVVLAENTLKEQKVLLLKMADYLSDNRQMTKQQTTKMLEKYVCNFDLNSLIENADLLFYRNHLKEKVTTIENEVERKPSLNSSGFSMNKKVIK